MGISRNFKNSHSLDSQMSLAIHSCVLCDIRPLIPAGASGSPCNFRFKNFKLIHPSLVCPSRPYEFYITTTLLDSLHPWDGSTTLQLGQVVMMDSVTRAASAAATTCHNKVANSNHHHHHSLRRFVVMSLFGLTWLYAKSQSKLP